MKLNGPMRVWTSAVRALLLIAAAVPPAANSAAAQSADAAGRNPVLAGDYFVGASVFLFERTVLAAFAPAGTADSMLDAGAITLAHENAGDESGAVALDAMVGWLDAWVAAGSGAAGAAEDVVPGFGPERRRWLACLIYGADPKSRAPLAQRAGLSEDDRADCIARYGDARRKWAAWLQPYRKSADLPSDKEPSLRLAFAPAVDEADQAIADAMQKNGLFQALTDEINAGLAMPRPITALLTQCGAVQALPTLAFYNPDRGEAVICYELLAQLLQAAPQ
jgi:hypothetical protein